MHWVLFLGIFVLGGEGLFAKPWAVYLTWKGDPTSSMVVHWMEKEKAAEEVLYYAEEGEEEMRAAPTFRGACPEGVKNQWAEIEGLKPDREYLFWLVREEGKAQEKAYGPYRFKTLPQELTRNVRFAVGGDAYFGIRRFRRMSAAVAAQSPEFVVVGGDIAYAFDVLKRFRGPEGEWNRWKTFLECWSEQMIDGEGRLIPLVPVVGNHDVQGKYDTYRQGKSPRPLFYDLFLFPQDMTAYRTLKAGAYLSLFLLDSGHTHKMEGQQRAWLQEQLEQSKPVPYKMVVYHVPAYPGGKGFDKYTATKIRDQWVGLFEQGGVKAAFENHGHVYKRTVPIFEGKEDPKGVVYLGDGSWGTRPRHPKEAWYLAKSAAVNAVFIVDLSPEACTIRALDIQGQFFDETHIRPCQ